MKLITGVIELTQLAEMASKGDYGLVKAVVDVDKQIMVVEAEMHADEEGFLIEKGSKQKDLWGINLYPDMYGTENFIEFDSMINLRPYQNNRTRGIEDRAIQEKIRQIVAKLIK